MRDLLDHDERVAQYEVDCELEAGQTKLRDLTRRFVENSERMKKAGEELDKLMSRAQTPAFLQVGSKIIMKSLLFKLPNQIKQSRYGTNKAENELLKLHLAQQQLKTQK